MGASVAFEAAEVGTFEMDADDHAGDLGVLIAACGDCTRRRGWWRPEVAVMSVGQRRAVPRAAWARTITATCSTVSVWVGKGDAPAAVGLDVPEGRGHDRGISRDAADSRGASSDSTLAIRPWRSRGRSGLGPRTGGDSSRMRASSGAWLRSLCSGQATGPPWNNGWSGAQADSASERLVSFRSRAASTKPRNRGWAAVGFGLELRVELDSDVPGMVGDLDDLDEVAGRRRCRRGSGRLLVKSRR